MYKSVTRGIQVLVEPQFLDNQSKPEEGKFIWAYTISVANLGSETVMLRSRHWIITDAFGRVQEVKGEGVVGEQPKLRPGERFQYTSGCPLSTPNGFMTGSYAMETDEGETFDVAIPTFSLDSPYDKHSVN